MTSAQHSSVPTGTSTTSGQTAPTGPTPNGERIPLQLEGIDPAQVGNILKLFQKSVSSNSLITFLRCNTCVLRLFNKFHVPVINDSVPTR